MTDITPADLAKFVHRVPVGATIPAGTPYAWRGSESEKISVRMDGWTDPTEQLDNGIARWTAEPVRAPEHQRLEDEYAKACDAIYAADAEVRAAVDRRDALAPAAQRLYDQLRAAGLR